MDAFKALRSPENVAAYKTFVAERKKENPQDKTDPEQPDPAVTLGMALTSYDLEDWKTAADGAQAAALRPASSATARRPQTDDKTGEVEGRAQRPVLGGDVQVLRRRPRKWAKAEPDNADAQKELEAVKTLLRRDYVAGPDEVGGAKWREGFERLRKELIPDLNLDELRQPSPARSRTQPADPVAAGTAAGS